MKHFMHSLFFIVVYLVLNLSQADAAYLVLDKPVSVVARPLTGSITYNLTGRVSFDVGFYSTGYKYIALGLVNDTSDLTKILGIGGDKPANLAPASNGGEYYGIVASFVINSNTVLSNYDMAYNGIDPAVTFYSSSSNGSVVTVSVTPSIRVVAAISVPEPASLILVVSGLLGSFFLTSPVAQHRFRIAGQASAKG